MATLTVKCAADKHNVKRDTLLRVVKRHPERFGAYQLGGSRNGIWMVNDESTGFIEWLAETRTLSEHGLRRIPETPQQKYNRKAYLKRKAQREAEKTQKDQKFAAIQIA